MELLARVGDDRYLDYNPLSAADSLSVLNDGRFTAAVVYPYEPRTEIGPFTGYSTRMAMAGPYVLGSWLRRSGFEMRVVQQIWNRNFQPSRAQLRDRSLDVLAISAMIMHSGQAQELIRDANRMGAERPLIACGGPKYIYQPQDGWKGEPECWPDVAVTGEAHVFLSLLTRLLEQKRPDESLASGFCRLRDHGEFQDIPGLVFKAPGNSLELIYTGTPQISKNLGDRPFLVEGLSLFEGPGRHRGLQANPLPLADLRNHVRGIAFPGLTEGCTRDCDYCPIPERMQGSYRWTSEEFVAEDLLRVFRESGINGFFAGDDSHFNSSFCEQLWPFLASVKLNGRNLQGQIMIGTEAVLADVEKRIHILPEAALGGLSRIWFGVETFNTPDLDKGQNPVNTEQVFRRMIECGILPMSMTILFPQQKWSGDEVRRYGVRETVDVLSGFGAAYFQMTHITPSPGSTGYKTPYAERRVLSRVGPIEIADRHYDGNLVIVDFSEGGKNPREMFWRQLAILGAHWRFYSPVKAFRIWRTYLQDRNSINQQRLRLSIFGLWQIAITTLRELPWLWRLWWGPWKKCETTPELKVKLIHTLDPAVVLRRKGKWQVPVSVE